jgi:ABC-2 type transport system ATP-binding protein
MQPIIQVNHLVKRYKRGTTNAVDDISFSVAPGELFALLGPNGAGKTTTISILTTTLAPTSGTVLIAGYDVSQNASAVRQNVGIIFQQPSLDLNLTAEENVRFHAILYGLYSFRPTFSLMPRAYQKQVNDLAAVLGIEDEIFKPVKTFSGGMKRKLEIIRSLIHRPRVLFLDEPTSGLDPASRRNLWEYLRQARAESNTTVFLTTHYLEESEEADTVCIINKGKIVSYGAPDRVKADLIQNYLLIDANDRAQLRDELRRLGIPFQETPPPALAPRLEGSSSPAPQVQGFPPKSGGQGFRIDLNGHSSQQIIKSIETPLTTLKTHTPTLEDAYLAILDQQ